MIREVPVSLPSLPVLLRSLGRRDVLVEGQQVIWPARSAEELLWFLHAHPEGRTRRDILAGLWNLDDIPSSANRFRVALHRLRTTLGSPQAVTEWDGRYMLDPGIVAASDTALLHEALAQAKQSRHPRECEDRLRRALASTEGDYLPHLQGDWVDAARAVHRAAVVKAHLSLSLLYCAARECPLAAQALARAAQQDPLMSEDHQQRLMACLATTRDRYAATEHYRRYRTFLAQEVGDTPLPDTVALAERLKAGEQPCKHAPFRPVGLRPD